MKIIQLSAKIGPGNGMGKGNAGDTAIGVAFENLFQKEFPSYEIEFMNCRKIFTMNDIDKINQADILFLSGGGLFLYDTFPNEVSDWQWGISEELLDKIKIPIVVYSIGYNKFRNQREFNHLFDKTVNKLVEKSILFSMRNSGSCNAVKKHVNQIHHKKIQLNFCPTLRLNEKYQFKNQHLQNNIGFVFGGDRLSLRHPNMKQFFKQMNIFVDYLKNNNVETILVNHLKDTWITKHIQFDRTIDLFEKDSRYIYQKYSEIDTVVADRGHGQMIPLAAGCKILTPISHDKLSWFLNDVNLSRFGIEEGDPKLGEKLIKCYQELSSLNWDPIHEKIMMKIRKTNENNIQIVKQELEKFNSSSLSH